MICFVQVLRLTRVFQVFKGCEPLIGAWLRQAAIVGGHDAVDTLAFFLLEMLQRKMAHLRVDGVDTSIKLNEGRTHQFIARRPPVFRQLCRNIGTDCSRRFSVSSSMSILWVILMFQPPN